MFCFQDWNSNYKRILKYLVSMRIFAFSMIIFYSCWEHFYSCSLPSVSKSKVKRREKINYAKFINTVRSIFNGYTITISIKYILILEKAFTNQREVINISLENSIIRVYLENLYNRFTLNFLNVCQGCNIKNKI